MTSRFPTLTRDIATLYAQEHEQKIMWRQHEAQITKQQEEENRRRAQTFVQVGERGGLGVEDVAARRAGTRGHMRAHIDSNVRARSRTHSL